MQEAKQSMSSLNLVFILSTLQVTTRALFYGPILYKKIPPIVLTTLQLTVCKRINA